MFLTGLSGHGSAASDNAPNLEPCASVGRPPLSKPGPSPRNPIHPGGVPPASGLAPAGQGEARSADLPGRARVDGKGRESLNVRVRLGVLDMWAQQDQAVPLGPPVLALEDENERVQARALEVAS